MSQEFYKFDFVEVTSYHGNDGRFKHRGFLLRFNKVLYPSPFYRNCYNDVYILIKIKNKYRVLGLGGPMAKTNLSDCRIVLTEKVIMETKETIDFLQASRIHYQQ
ncbi:MAG TPA: hypothetical protein VNX68_19410 [Nitrosopumilaceae archaeon]|jgi:hypothetical protein|nr:hypothetical protein [Nitrosopumilaceae archaeon]